MTILSEQRKTKAIISLPDSEAKQRLCFRICKSRLFYDLSFISSQYEPRCEKTGLRSDTNQTVNPLKMARGLKFRIQGVEELYYPCSENKGADQLCGYREAELRLYFRIYKDPVFL